MVLTKLLTLLIFLFVLVVFKKTVFLRILLANSHQMNIENDFFSQELAERILKKQSF